MEPSFNNLNVIPFDNGTFDLHVNNHPYAKINVTMVFSEEEAELQFAVFKVGNALFRASEETYRVTCNFSDDEVLRYKMDDNLSEKIVERLSSIAVLYDSIVGIVSHELSDDSELLCIRLFNSIRLIPSVVQPVSQKIVKRSAINYGVKLDSNGEAIIDLNKVISKSMKVIKLGITLSGKFVVIEKPYLKRGIDSKDKLTPEERKEIKERAISYWFKELLILKHFKKMHDEKKLSEQILTPRSYFCHRNYTSMIFDKMECDLDEYLNKNPNLTSTDRLRLCYEVAKAVNYLHTSLQLTHRDLKARNFLCDLSGRIYLIDWGFTRILSHDRSLDNTGLDGALSHSEGTKGFVPPEGHSLYISNSPIPEISNELWDSWSLGVLYYNIMENKNLNFQTLQKQRKYAPALEKILILERTPLPAERTIQYVTRMYLRHDMRDRWTVRTGFPVVQTLYNTLLRINIAPRPAAAEDVTMISKEEKKRGNEASGKQEGQSKKTKEEKKV